MRSSLYFAFSASFAFCTFAGSTSGLGFLSVALGFSALFSARANFSKSFRAFVRGSVNGSWRLALISFLTMRPVPASVAADKI